MEDIVLTHNIELPSSQLDKNIKIHLKTQLEAQLKDTCSKKHGYIIDIADILKINHNKILNTSSYINFNVDFKCTRLLPLVNRIVNCNVNMVFNHGIFANIHMLKILIPSLELKNYKFNHTKNIYYNDVRKIEKNDKVDIIIKDIKYMNKEYSCIGVLKE